MRNACERAALRPAHGSWCRRPTQLWDHTCGKLLKSVAGGSTTPDLRQKTKRPGFLDRDPGLEEKFESQGVRLSAPHARVRKILLPALCGKAGSAKVGRMPTGVGQRDAAQRATQTRLLAGERTQALEGQQTLQGGAIGFHDGLGGSEGLKKGSNEAASDAARSNCKDSSLFGQALLRYFFRRRETAR